MQFCSLDGCAACPRLALSADLTAQSRLHCDLRRKAHLEQEHEASEKILDLRSAHQFRYCRLNSTDTGLRSKLSHSLSDPQNLNLDRQLIACLDTSKKKSAIKTNQEKSRFSGHFNSTQHGENTGGLSHSLSDQNGGKDMRRGRYIVLVRCYKFVRLKRLTRLIVNHAID